MRIPNLLHPSPGCRRVLAFAVAFISPLYHHPPSPAPSTQLSPNLRSSPYLYMYNSSSLPPLHPRPTSLPSRPQSRSTLFATSSPPTQTAPLLTRCCTASSTASGQTTPATLPAQRHSSPPSWMRTTPSLRKTPSSSSTRAASPLPSEPYSPTCLSCPPTSHNLSDARRARWLTKGHPA